MSFKDAVILMFVVAAGILFERRIQSLMELFQTQNDQSNQNIQVLTEAVTVEKNNYQALKRKYEDLLQQHRRVEAIVNEDTGILKVDAIAQAICVASIKYQFVFAVRRNCSLPTTCNTICTNAAGDMNKLIANQATKFTCAGTYHLYSMPHYRAVVGKPVMGAYKYLMSSCEETACGPNYCCCLGQN